MEKKKISFLCVLRNAVHFAVYLKETFKTLRKTELSANEENIPAVLSQDERLIAKAFLKYNFDHKYHVDLSCRQTANS